MFFRNINSLALVLKVSTNLDGRILAEEARVVLDQFVGLGLVQEINQLQELLKRELVKSLLVTRHAVVRH